MNSTSALTPEQRRIRARAAAFALHSQGGTNTAPALAARMRRYEDQVDPERVLAPDVRARRANQALRADMARLSLKASRSRNKKAPTAIVSPVGANGGRHVPDGEPPAAA